MFGEHLKQLREEAKLTQRELAERTGLAATYISDLERNRRPAPNHDTCIKFLQAIPDSDAFTLLYQAALSRTYVRLNKEDLSQEQWDLISTITALVPTMDRYECNRVLTRLHHEFFTEEPEGK